ncbi:MAG: Cache 3/Cache 2 fusion domain-containing protein, partial [Aeromicrobium sp.]|nr:Cache 3/Cache 2 fusion domain-containing protein [Burkholderiales bacterium]
MTHKRALSKILSILVLSFFATVAIANDPKAAIDSLDAKLGKLGAPKVEGTAKVGEKDLPGLFFGSRRINSNYDVVDDIKKTTGAAATVFVKDGEEFVRVSTNVLT